MNERANRSGKKVLIDRCQLRGMMRNVIVLNGELAIETHPSIIW
jgi:hypothetical protein